MINKKINLKSITDHSEYKALNITFWLMLVTIFMIMFTHPSVNVKVFVGGGALLALILSILLANKGILVEQYKYITLGIFYFVGFFYIGCMNGGGYVNLMNLFVGVGFFSLYNNCRLTIVNSIVGFCILNVSAIYYKDTIFQGVNSDEIITFNIYYILLCLALIMANNLGEKLRQSSSK